jgi:hypothetical protein
VVVPRREVVRLLDLPSRVLCIVDLIWGMSQRI